MSERPVAAFIWIGVLTNLKKISLEKGIACHTKLCQAGKTSPWLYFFDILSDKNSQFCFLKNDRRYQGIILSFIEQKSASIPKYLLKRFYHILSSEEDLKKIRSCMGEITPAVVGPEFKRQLSSPELPESKHICLDRRTPEKSPPADVPIFDSKVSKTEDVAAEDNGGCLKPAVKLLSLEELLQLDDSQLVSHLTDFSLEGDSKHFVDVSYDDMTTVLKRVKNSPVAFQNLVTSVAIPFLASKKVCTRNDSAIISECLDSGAIDYVHFVVDILKSCKKQIIDGTAKIVLKSTIIDDILSGFTDLKHWSEDITAFLVLVVKDTCSVVAVGSVLQYLVTYSDEKSSKSCSLVMKILKNYSENEIIVKLCSQFAERSKCFLRKTLLQMLDDVLDGDSSSQ